MRTIWGLVALAPWLLLPLHLPLLLKLESIPTGRRIPIPYPEVALSLGALAVGWAAIVAYIVRMIRNGALQRRGLWIIGAIFFSGLVLPLYWWREDR